MDSTVIRVHSEGDDDEFEAINRDAVLENQVEHQDAGNDEDVQMDIEQAGFEEVENAAEHEDGNNESVNGSLKDANQELSNGLANNEDLDYPQNSLDKFDNSFLKNSDGEGLISKTCSNGYEQNGEELNEKDHEGVAGHYNQGTGEYSQVNSNNNASNSGLNLSEKPTQASDHIGESNNLAQEIEVSNQELVKSVSNYRDDERPIKPTSFQSFDEVPIPSVKMDIEEDGFSHKTNSNTVQTAAPKGPLAKNKQNLKKAGKTSKPVSMRPSDEFAVPEDRPITNQGGYQQSDQEERPISGKGAYKFEEESNGGNAWNDPNDERPIQTLKSNNPFDEVPIGGGSRKGNAGAFSEYPEGADPSEFDPSASNKEEESGPLEKRIRSKIVKTRQNAFDELAKDIEAADESDGIIYEYAAEFIKFIAESNPAAQERAIYASKAYLTKVSVPSIDTKNFVKVLIDKALGPAKPNTKKVSNEVLCLLFEKCDKNALFEGITDSISAKNQKTSCAGAQAIVELLINYGPRKLDYLKPFFGPIEKLAASTVAPLRNEAMAFYKEALKWMGEAVKTFTSKLKKQQIEELDKFYDEWPKQPMKPLRGEEEQPIGISKVQGKNAKAADISGLDPYDIADPVDIFHKFNDPWCEKVLAQQKWSEKKQMLDELVKAATAPKLAPTNYFHINAMLKRLLGDSNVAVMLTAIKIYGLLAKGLRKNFAATARSASPLIMQKFREKKTLVLEETYRTFDLFFYSISLEDIAEDLKEGLADRNTVAKVNILGLIDKFVEKNAQTPEKCEPLFKGMIGTLKGLLNDGDGSVRNATMMTLGKMKTILGDRIIGGYLNDIDQNKLNKINDQAHRIEAMEEEKEAPSSLNSSTVISRPQSSAGNQPAKKTEPHSTKSNASGPTQQKTQASGNLKKNASTKNLNAPHTTSGGDNENEFVASISAEDAESKLTDMGVPEAIFKGLEAANPKDKAETLSKFAQWVNENISTIADCSEVVIRFLKAKLKDWKELNLMMNKENFALINSLCHKSEVNLNKRGFFYVCGLLVNNCHDVKFNDSINSIIRAFVEQVTPKFVINSLISLAQDAKATKPNPKTYVEICNILVKLLDELTVRFFPLKETIEYGKFAITNQNPQCRAAAIGLFKALYAQVGQPISDLINDIPPQTLKPLQAEFEKVTLITDLESKVKVQFRGEVAAEVRSVTASNPLDSIPRADVSKEADKIIKALSNADWRVRKEGLDQLEQLLTNNKNRISPNGLHDLVVVLKTRLTDSNKALARGFINFIGKLTTALGKDIQRYAKTFIPPLISNLSDKQVQIRQDAISCLEKIGNEVGQDVIVSSALPMLAQDNPEMRSEVINLVLKYADCLPKVDIRSNVSPILSALQDKSKEIRANTEKLLEKCVNIIGPGPFSTAVKDLKSAIQNDLKPIISKYGGGFTESLNDLDSSLTIGSRKSDPRIGNKKQTMTPTANTNGAAALALNQSKVQGVPTNNSAMPPMSGMTRPSPKKTLQGSNSTSNLTNSIVLSNAQVPAPQFHRTNSVTPTKYPERKLNPLNPHSIITATGQKGQRIEEEKRFRWSTNELNDDLIDKLKENLRSHISSELLSKMFAYDHRKHVEAISVLKKALATELPATLDILDLIIRWIFVRLFENSNAQTLKEILGYVTELVNSLEAIKYSLLPLEAQVLVPVLIERFNTTCPGIKSSLIRNIIKLGNICPPASTVMMLLQGLNSKSHKVRIDCLETLTGVAQHYGSQVFNPKDIRFFGKLLSHENSEIRTAAMNLLAEIGRNSTDNPLSVLSDLPLRAQQELQNKIQNEGPKKIINDDDKTQEDSEQPLYRASPERAHTVYQAQSEFPQQQMSVPHLYNQPGVGAHGSSNLGIQGQAQVVRENEHRQSHRVEEQPRKQAPNQKVDEEVFDRSLNALFNGNTSERLDAILLIENFVYSESEENKKLIKIKANSLMEALNCTLKLIFERPRTEISTRFVNYFLNTCHKFCSVKTFLRNVSERNLNDYTDELLNRLLAEDETKTEDSDSETRVKMLNSTILRVLENANPNDVFCVLFDLLIKHRRLVSYAKILGLLIKCILKLTKCLEQILPAVQPEKIILKSHLYLVEFANSSAPMGDDIGIKTIKTILNELVKIFKEKIWDYYAVLQTHPTPDAYMHRWITVILRPLSTANTVSPKITQNQMPQMQFNGVIEKKPPTPSNQMTNPPLQNIGLNTLTLAAMQNSQKENINDFYENPEINGLVENLKKTDNFEEGIQALYEAILRNPGMNIGPYFRGCSKTFVDYVMTALERANFQRNNPSTMQLSMVDTTPSSQIVDPRYQSNTMANNQNKMLPGQDQREPLENSSNPKGTNLEEFHNKVNNLKKRYGLLLKKDNNENQGPNNISLPQVQVNSQQVKALNSLISNSNVPVPTNFDAKNFVATPGNGNNKTENILQKLNEMKAKMNSIVNSGKNGVNS